MEIARFHSVLTADPEALRESIIPADDHSGIAGGAQVFRGIKAEIADLAHGARFRGRATERIFGADGLGRVFDHVQLKAFRDSWMASISQQRPKRCTGTMARTILPCRLPQESVFSPATLLDQITLQRGRGDVIRFGIDIDEDRRGADPRDAAAGGKERIGARDHGVARVRSPEP